MDQEVATQVVALGGSTDFSLIQLFLRADFIVKSVIIILIAASVYSWALIFEKYRLFKKIDQTTTNFENKFCNLWSQYPEGDGYPSQLFNSNKNISFTS